MIDRIAALSSEWGSKIADAVGDFTPAGLLKSAGKANVASHYDHHFVSKLLPYETYDPETSLFINKTSAGFILETTPLIGSSEEIENILSSIVTDILPPNSDMQFLLIASPKVGNALDAFEKERSGSEMFAWLAKKRTDYLKKGAFDSISRNSSLMIRNFRLLISVSVVQSHDYEGELMGLRDDLQSSLQSINMNSHTINAEDFLSVISDLITPTRDLHPNHIQWNELDSLSLQLTHPEWRMQVKSDSINFASDEESVEACCLTVREFPNKATQWKVTENLGQLFNATLQIPCPFVVSFTIRKMDNEKSRADSQINVMSKESTAKSPLSKFKPSVNKEYEDWEFVRSRLSEGDCLVKSFYEVIIFAEPNKIHACERRVRDLYRANGWKLKKESFLQLQSWLAMLPFMMTEGLFKDLKYFGRLRTMTAFNAVNIAPLQGEWVGTQTASLLLPGRRGQIAFWNPFDNDSGNYNIAITAAPGKGKSAFTQDYINAILSAGGRVWVIDAGRSYEKTCLNFNGQFIEFTQNSRICLNPFTSITDINESIIMLKPLLASMARPVRGATEEELSYIEQAIKAAWDRKGNQATITTVADWLEERPEEICKNLSHLLFSYSKDGIYAPFFEGVCTVDFENRYIVMELQELKAKKDLQRIVLQVLIYLISQKMYLTGRKEIKSCIIDESWDLFDSDDIATAKFIEAGYRTARKFRGNFVSIAHSITDFYKNAMSRAAFDCADFKIILGQTEEAINKLKRENIMDIDGFTERLLKSLKLTRDYSECVIKSPSGMSVHRIIFDPYSRILYSTKGEEFEAVNQLVASGVPLVDAIQQVAKDFNHV